MAIVDNDSAVRRALGRLIRLISYRPAEFASGAALLASLVSETPCCVILDHQMPDMDGLNVLRLMRDIRSEVPVIIITGFDEPGMSEKYHRAGAAAYLTKPVGSSAVRAAIEAARGG